MVPAVLALLLMEPQIQYPPSKVVDHVDQYHGIAVRDPYRWLEQPITTPEVKEWVDAQNKVTFDYLEKIPGRDRYYQELERRINFERFSAPVKRGDRIFYTRNSGLQNQDVLYVEDRPGSEPRILLDPNTFSEDGTIALAGLDYSLDGKTLLYGVAQAGSDWLEWHVLNIDNGQKVGNPVKHSKFGGGVLNTDGTGFYYLRYPEPKEGEAFTEANTAPSIHYHQIGTEQSQDRLVFNLPDNPEAFLFPYMDPAKSVLFLYIDEPGSINNRLHILDLKDPNAQIVPLFDQNDASYSAFHAQGGRVWVQTNKDAPRGKILVADYIRDIAPREIVPQSEDTLESSSIVGDKLVLAYMKDAHSAVRIHDLLGRPDHTVELPGLGSVSGFGGLPGDPVTYFSYADFTTPATIYKYDVDSKDSEVYKKPQVAIDTAKYESKQVFVESVDGTKVPMFIIYKKGLKLDGNNPTLLYGYGGFNASQTPWFSTARTVWLDSGGVWCLANIRGGGEYGKEWHESAIKTKRQNAYDDFISCAEWLIKNDYTKPARLAIQGGSNGGLLVGACVNQRPDLFGVALPAVGVMDMLRFNQFTIGKAWEADYGSPDNLDEFLALLRISPYHNLTPGTNYPAILVTTADTDDRVVPAHSFKYAARLQASQAADRPVLIRIETSAGHGAGKPISKVLEEIRDEHTFILHNMNTPVPDKFD